MKTRGFTTMELAIVLSVSALLLPLVFQFLRAVTAVSDTASFKLDVAASLRGLGEQLEADALRSDCQARWRLEPDGRLHRAATEACGGDQVLATRVTRFERVEDRTELTFSRPLSPDRTLSVEAVLAGVAP